MEITDLDYLMNWQKKKLERERDLSSDEDRAFKLVIEVLHDLLGMEESDLAVTEEQAIRRVIRDF